MSSNISATLKQAFNKVLPIPKAPRGYRYYTPAKPLAWVPRGSITSWKYVERLESFANEILIINRQRTKPVKYSSRGWCYLLEGLGKIDKGEFSAAQRAINDCRKLGLLPIDFVAQDQDMTRHFKGIHEACKPEVQLQGLQTEIDNMLEDLPSKTTDYWVGEKYYVMMCVEKGDLISLFKPVCDKYHVPLVSSKGWAPILLRSHIADLCVKAEFNNLKPVMLLFYDHDPAGLKITRTFRKNLADCEGGTGWNPRNLIIDRFGLNAEDIEQYKLMWIDNLKTGSGRQSRDADYIEAYGYRKCEANALFKNDTTLEAGAEICRKAIEKYYGEDALKRFEAKEKVSKEKLKDVYANPVWDNVKESLAGLIEQVGSEEKVVDTTKETKELKSEQETIVFMGTDVYGECPKCHVKFRKKKEDHNKRVRCRDCGLLMRLKDKAQEKETDFKPETTNVWGDS